VNDVVTVTVHQAQVVEGVVVVIPVVMVHLYHVLCREAQPAECATTTLSFEQPRDPSRFVRITPQPGGPVDPIAVPSAALRAGSGAFVALHFNKASDRRRLVKAENAFTIAETHSPVHLTPVAVIAPLAALAWVAVSGPAGELVVEGVVQDLEVVFGDAVLVVVGPALDHRIEGVDETCLRRTAMVLDDVPQLVPVALQRLATGFDEGLVTGLAPVSASAMLAHRILPYVKGPGGCSIRSQSRSSRHMVRGCG